MKKKIPYCFCHSGKLFSQCCEPVLGGQIPQTAEQLMRSRYSAYTQNNESYLLETWHLSTRPGDLSLVDQKHIKWFDLKILRHETKATTAMVEFIARYKLNGKAEKIHELSRFVKQDNRWFYVDGDQY